MFRSLITPLVVAAILLVPASAAPAYADGKDLAKVLIGIAAIYALGRYVEQRRGEPFELDVPGLPGRSPAPVSRDRNRLDMVLPEACRTTTSHGGLYGRAYDKQCLERRLAYPELLPESCERSLPDAGGRRPVYDARCLARDGWQDADDYAGW